MILKKNKDMDFLMIGSVAKKTLNVSAIINYTVGYFYQCGVQLDLLNLLSCLFTTGQKDDRLYIIYNSTSSMVLSLGKLMQMPTVFVRTLSMETILLWKLECGN